MTQAASPESSPASLRVAVLASCTVDLFTPQLVSALGNRGVQTEVWAAGFDQYRQAILDPQSQLYRFDPQFVLLYLDGQDLFADLIESPLDFTPSQRRERLERIGSEIRTLVEQVSVALPRATILLNSVALPPNLLGGLEYNSEYSLQDVARDWNAGLAELSRKSPAVSIVDTAAATASMGFSNWSDARLWYLARSRWSRLAVRELARRYSAAIAGQLGLMRKCLVLDLDNTLWGGIVGEDGPTGLRLGEEGPGRAFQEFQVAIRSLQRQGVLLAICSKNNPDDALEVLRSHPGMRLRPEHFAAMRINWEDKAANLHAIAQELNIGIESLVFLDDNPAERVRVREGAPQVLVPEWPEDPGDFKAALFEIAADHFYKVAVTAEDLERGRQYREQAARRSVETTAGSIEDYYRALDMRAVIAPVTSFSLPRIAQLTQKTNQFNLTTRRYTEQQVADMAASGSLVLSLDLDDRFGKNGIVGVMVLRPEEDGAWKIDTFLLSCRVMGRTAENAFLGAACRHLRDRGAVRLIGEYRPTAKNAPVAEVYAKFGFRQTSATRDEQIWEIDLRTQDVAIPEWFTITAEFASTEKNYAR